MWLSGKDKNSFWKKSKNPRSSREFVKFTFGLSITSVEQLHLKKDFGNIKKSISCQGYPWNPWANFFQLVTVIPRGEHHLVPLSARRLNQDIEKYQSLELLWRASHGFPYQKITKKNLSFPNILGAIPTRAVFFSQLLVNHGRVCQISCEIFRI